MKTRGFAPDGFFVDTTTLTRYEFPPLICASERDLPDDISNPNNS